MVAYVRSCKRSIDRIAQRLIVRSVILLFICSIASVGQTQQIVLGAAEIQGSLDTTSVGVAEAFPFAAHSSGQVNSLSVFLDSSNTAAAVGIAVYASYSGHPSKLLSQAAILHPVPGQWNAVAIPSVQVTQWRR